jgi:hypothetical protein
MAVYSGKHSRLPIGLDPLIRRQRSLANDGADSDDRSRENQQPKRNRAILAFAFGCARGRGCIGKVLSHGCLLRPFEKNFARASLSGRDTGAAYVVVPTATRRRLRRPARTGYGGRHDGAIRRLVRGHHAQRLAEHNKPEENQRDAAIDDGNAARPLRVCKPVGFASQGLSNHPRLSNEFDPI